jgi:hypothetical protein
MTEIELLQQILDSLRVFRLVFAFFAGFVLAALFLIWKKLDG